VFSCSLAAQSWETHLDPGKIVSRRAPGRLSRRLDGPIAAMQIELGLEGGERARFSFCFALGRTAEEALRNHDRAPEAAEGLRRTRRFFASILERARLITPNPEVNRGVLWAKANMLRVQLHAPTGWCFTNDPARSSNSVGRDTAWFAMGADYVEPGFARASLMAWLERQKPDGMIVEYYDIIDGHTDDYGLNVNDNTPLIILALWHHYATTGDGGFLREVYPPARRAARQLLSQRREDGLVWCTARGTGAHGIAGWRNVIPGGTLSGATTELNAECCAALHTVGEMARALGDREAADYFQDEAARLREAVNAHLLDQKTGYYYLNIDLDGRPHTDITCDQVFPLMFGVADDQTAAHVIRRLSDRDFWTPAGIRTVPRDAIDYTPSDASGLLGGVWVGVSFWYAFAAARFSPNFMDHALSASFHNYSRNPREKNTVPGQFSEWLHGETLVNRGMMLSPWFPPRYLWAAIEGAAGIGLSSSKLTLRPNLAFDWKWMAVSRLPYRGRFLTWFAVRVAESARGAAAGRRGPRSAELCVYGNFPCETDFEHAVFEEDVTDRIRTAARPAHGVALRSADRLVVLVASSDESTLTTSVRFHRKLVEGLDGWRMRTFDSLTGRWEDGGAVSPRQLRDGVVVQVERKGYEVLELTPPG
jgi:hypothetical protein